MINSPCLQEQFIRKYLQYIQLQILKLLSHFRFVRLGFKVSGLELKICKGQSFFNWLYILIGQTEKYTQPRLESKLQLLESQLNALPT